MKKSEMIKIIKEEVNLLVKDVNYVSEEGAEHLLNLIEEKGMLPPTLESKSFQMLPSGELIYQVNEWEPE